MTSKESRESEVRLWGAEFSLDVRMNKIDGKAYQELARRWMFGLLRNLLAQALTLSEWQGQDFVQPLGLQMSPGYLLDW